MRFTPGSTQAEELVASTDVPLMAVELPSGRILAANAALAAVLDKPLDELQYHSSIDLIVPSDRAFARAAMKSLVSGELTGYQAVRRIRSNDGKERELGFWVSAVDIDTQRVGLASVIPYSGVDSQFQPLTNMSQFPTPGDVVLGTVDEEWRVDRISQDVLHVLGLSAETCRGLPVLGVLYPLDVSSFVAAVEHAKRGQRAVRLVLRLRARSGEWRSLACVLTTISSGNPPALAFALLRDLGESDGLDRLNRSSHFEMSLQRIADELRAAGIVARLQTMPDLTRVPELATLTSREWEIVTRLLDGERVPAIASDMFVSQKTVRSHLSSVFSKLGIHSQAELIQKLRGRSD